MTTAPTPTRRILLCATGMSPQIVTETLYALAVKPAEGKTPWIPDEIHLISTTTGAAQARLNLLTEAPGWFHKLRHDYSLPEIKFSNDTIHCIQDAQGRDLDDIRSPQDNESAANSIAELVRKLTEDSNSELHVSLAGGRKTMGYYMGYALSLYGRPQDTLSHILVSGIFEGHPQFYYPTPYPSIIHTRGEKTQALDCADAIIELAEIPFVRLREGLPQRLLDGKANFTETVNVANLAQGEAHLHIDTRTHAVTVNGLPVNLSNTEFALYYWLAQRALSETPEIRWSEYEEWQDGYQPLLVKLFGVSKISSITERAEQALYKDTNDRKKTVNKYFEPIKADMNKALSEQLGAALSQRCKSPKPHRGGGHRLPPDLRITIG